MYATWVNHLPVILHLLIAGWFLYLLMPRFIFNPCSDDGLDNTFARYISMVFVIIVAGYILVFAKVYEVASILLVIFFLVYRKYAKTELQSSWKIKIASWQLLVFDYLENNRLLKKSLHEAKPKFAEYWRSRFNPETINWFNLVCNLLLLGVLAYSAYLRFYDVFHHAALPMTDSYTTLAWAKHIEQKIPFYNYGGGVYPRGLSIYLATFHKFAFVDALYILKYIGPLNSLTITLGLYFVLSRWTENRIAGLVGAAMYGIFGFTLFGGDWDRHAATNSQEFALVFVLPMTYFFYRYLRNPRPVDWRVGFAALAIAGLTHTLVFAYMIAIIGIMTVFSILMGLKGYWGRIKPLLTAVVLASVIAAIPLLYGQLTGVRLHEASVDFLTSQSSTLTYSKLHWADYAGLAGLALCLLKMVFQPKLLPAFHWEKVFFFLGIGSFILYYAGGPLTGSVLMAVRMGIFWSLLAAFSIGYAWYVCWVGLTALSQTFQAVQICAFVTAAVLLILYLQPPVIMPYKMEWDSDVEQYLKINTHFRPLTWVIVSQENGYAVILGQGFHMYTKDLLTFEPRFKFIKKWGNLPENIFIYYYKRIYEVSRANAIYTIEKPIYQRLGQEMPALVQWLQRYRAAHFGPLNVFYEDRNLRVYYLKNPYYIYKSRREH